MAWSVNNLMECFKFMLRKNQAGGIRASDLFYAWNTEQTVMHADLLGRWQSRSNNKTGNNTGLIQNETVITSLTPFIANASILIVTGRVTKPVGFSYTLDLRLGNSSVFPITHDQSTAVVNSVLDAPSTTTNTYYYKEYSNYYSLIPASATGNANLDYVKDVTDIVWGFTLDVNGRQVYDSATSVQPLWGQDDIITITKRTLTNFGISFKDNEFLNAGRVAQATGD